MTLKLELLFAYAFGSWVISYMGNENALPWQFVQDITEHIRKSPSAIVPLLACVT